MAKAAEQIEKHTIVARLSLSIYQMDDRELVKVLKLLDSSSFSENSEGDTNVYLERSEDPRINRQLIIARLFVLINQMDKDTLLQRLRPYQHPDFCWVREYPRLECYLVVDFAAGGKAYRSCIRNISASGVFIETQESFEAGQTIALCFTLSESAEMLPFKVMGKVVRVYAEGIGVQYENMSDYQRDIISTLVSSQK